MKRIALLLFSFSLLSMVTRAQECLKPINQTEQHIWGKKYFDNWYNEDADQQFLIFPSFSGHSALYIYSRGTLAGTLVVKDNPLRKKDAMIDTSKDSISMNVGQATTERLSNLIHHAVCTSNYQYDRIGFDGTKYFFFDRFNGATTWSPVGTCGRMVKILEGIMKAVQAGDKAQIEAQWPAIDSLTTHFKSHYPEEFFHNVSISREHAYRSGLEQHIIRLHIGFDILQLQFTYSNPYDENLPEQLRTRFSPLLESLLRYLFMSTSLLQHSASPLDLGSFSIQVDDTQPQSLTKKHHNYTLSVHQDDLTLDRLKQLIEEEHK